MNVGRKELHKGVKMESKYVDEFCGTGADRNSGSARTFLFVDFRMELKAASVDTGIDAVGGCGREIVRGDDVGNSLEDEGLVFRCGVMANG